MTEEKEKPSPLEATFVEPAPVQAVPEATEIDGKKKKKKKGKKDKKEKDKNDLPPVPFFQLFRFATGMEKFLMILSCLGGVITGLSQPANTFIFGRLTEALAIKGMNQSGVPPVVPPPADFDFLYEIDLFSLNNTILGVILLVVTYLSLVLFNYTCQSQIMEIRKRYFRSALYQDISWYDVNNTGDFASRMAEDLNKLEDGIGEKVVLYVHFMAAFASSMILALCLGWKLALVCLSSLPLTAIIMGTVAFISSKLSGNELQAYGRAGSIAEEVLGSVRTVIAFSGQAKEIKRYKENLIYAKNNNVRKQMLSGIGFGFLWFIIYASYALAFWYGFKLIVEEHYTIGHMTTVFFSVMMGSMNFGMSTPYIEAFSSAKAAGAKIFSVIDRISPIDASSPKGEKLDKVRGDIEFKNVYFDYPSRVDVKILQGLNLKIKKGEKVALVGSSGCGKSTCIQLIQRFYDPHDGQVLFDGVPLNELNVGWLRSHIGVVGQEPVLFSASIEDNIRYAKDDATEEEIIAACKLSNAHDFITKLPNGYKTLVGERGAQMSGGQKQRVAIARALIRNPQILLLDEATSALDTASEAKVQQALDKAAAGRTTIIVAHRLSTIRHADKIVVINQGKLGEVGTHDELMEQRGHYYKLVTAQIGEDDEDVIAEGDAGISKAMHRQLSKQISIMSVKSEDSAAGEIVEIDEEYVSDVPPKAPPVGLLQILRLNKEEWLPITIGTIASIIIGCGMPVFSLIFGDMIGTFGKGPDDFERLRNLYAICFVIAGVVIGFSTFLQIYMYGISGEILTMKIRGIIFESMLKQEAAWFDIKYNSVGALCARLSNDASSVQGATGQRIGTVVQSIATIILAVGMAMYFQWKLGLVAICFCPIILIAFYIMRSMMSGDGFGLQVALEKSTKTAVEAVSNIRTVAGLVRETKFYDTYVEELKPNHKIAMRNMHFRGLTMGISRSIVFFAYATCMYYGGRLIENENVEYSKILKVSQALIMGTFSIANALAFSPNFSKGFSAAANVFMLMRRVPKIKDKADRNDANWESEGNVKFEDVQFRYPSRPEVKVLRGLDLSVFKGKTIALVGHSGCGKSTCIQLLERFYDPLDGKVSVDQRELPSLSLNTLRSQLGLVSQEPILFDRTIAQNIAYGDNSREVPMEEVIEAAKKSNIHNFITSLPLGYETSLGEKGTQLSGGQKQRVAIARALVRNPRVLLLDEATSALDTESEKIVQEALDAARLGRTCITIAHRLSTIVDADMICVISHGRVAELGTHQELLAKKGIYKQLWSLQAGNK